jgi:hypothetical protein
MCQKYPCRLITETFNRTEALFSAFNFKCSQEDQIALKKAFKNKKNNLDRVHNEMLSKDVRN